MMCTVLHVRVCLFLTYCCSLRAMVLPWCLFLPCMLVRTECFSGVGTTFQFQLWHSLVIQSLYWSCAGGGAGKVGPRRRGREGEEVVQLYIHVTIEYEYNPPPPYLPKIVCVISITINGFTYLFIIATHVHA